MDTTTNENEEGGERVRDKYLSLTERLRARINASGEYGVKNEEITDMMEQADNCFVKIPADKRGVNDLLMDASLYKDISSCVKCKIVGSNASSKVFRPQEFARGVVNLMMPQTRGEEPPNLTREHWTSFGYTMMHMYKYAFGVEPLLGAMETLEPPRPPRVVKRRTKEAEVKKTMPDQLKEGESDSELKTGEVARIYKLLKQYYKERKGPISFFHFVVNPQSFGLTVENMFHMSFLTNNKLVNIKEDQNGIPVLIPLRANAGPYTSTDTTEKKSYQCILHMDMQEWKELIDVFDIKEAMIPPRPRAQNKRTV